MCFGNVPKDLCLTSLASLRSTASKSTNGFFSADIRTVGALLQYQRSPGVQVTAESQTVPATQLGNLYTLPVGTVPSDVSVSKDGLIIAVGLNAVTQGDSVVSIFTNTAGFYTETVIPLPVDASATSQIGEVSLNDSGDILALGIPTDNNSIGAVWIYYLVAGVWTLQGPKITGPGEIGAGSFGVKVSLDGYGTLLAVGSSEDDGSKGAAYIFNINYPLAPVFVQKLTGLGSTEEFGYSVNFSSDGSTLAVGAPSIFSGTTNGAVYIFTNDQGLWLQQVLLQAPPGFTIYGITVSLSGDGYLLAIGSNDNIATSYRKPGHVGLSAWEYGPVIPLPYDLVGALNLYSASLSQDGNTLCTSNSNNNGNVGASWIFTQGPFGTWIQNGPGFVGTGGTLNQGQSGSLSGNGKYVAITNQVSELWVFV